MWKRIANLFSVKSIVTIILTIVFAVLAVRGNIGDYFQTIYLVVVSFYFGTQSQKLQEAINKDNNTATTASSSKEE